jgi:taurine dioxygenase
MTAPTSNEVSPAEGYRTFELELPTPRIGGLIRDLDLREELSEDCKAELKRALAERGVLFLPGQQITPADHERFARIFGELRERETFFGRPEGSPYMEVIDGYGESKGTDVWHTDVSWQPLPPVATCLHAQVLPPTGGDTIWASMTWAYAELSPRLKSLIDDLTATHTWEKSISGFVKSLPDGEAIYRRQRQDYPPVVRKVVERHPVTGLPVLYVNDLYTTHLNGIPRSEAIALLDYLTGLAAVPEYQVRFKWQPHSVVIWDNLGVQHYAVTDHKPHYRRLHRLTINDDENTFKPAS